MAKIVQKSKGDTEPGAGVRRAAARLQAHREAQVKRLANAPEPTGESRQVRRQAERRSLKMPLRAPQADWHRQQGLAVSRKMKARAERGAY